ncbi:hypothetical protein DXG01_000638 [Tephrocybe rancida]|nr:hypothetical protein DXG01_000638 [Tephrocybe rancida]
MSSLSPGIGSTGNSNSAAHDDGLDEELPPAYTPSPDMQQGESTVQYAPAYSATVCSSITTTTDASDPRAVCAIESEPEAIIAAATTRDGASRHVIKPRGSLASSSICTLGFKFEPEYWEFEQVELPWGAAAAYGAQLELQPLNF